MREDLGWEENARIRHLKTLAQAGEIVVPRLTLDVIREDPPDNRILECAVEGRAHLIVSGDRPTCVALRFTKASLLWADRFPADAGSHLATLRE
jgi:predicted nucleic acid-binding protein